MDSGTYYLRNRSHQPATGRFLTEDPVHDGLNWYTYCNGNPIIFIDPLGLERIVVSGGSDGAENFRYNFIETAIKQIIDWQAASDETIAWFIANWNYSAEDLINFQAVADSYGVPLSIMSDKQQLFDYIGKEGRADDLISAISFFAHGTAFDMPDGGPNEGYTNQYALALGYSGLVGGEHPHDNAINIFASDLENISSSAFTADNYTFFGTCRTGNSFNGVVFAQEWVNTTKTGAARNTTAQINPRGESNINN